MQLTVNGQQQQIEDGATVSLLVRRHALQPQRVAVEINQRLVPRAQFDQTPLCEGDQVEIVTFVGGG